MRRHSTIACLLLAIQGWAQVHVDKPVRFNSGDPAARQIEGLAAPQQEDAAITLGTARSGSLHFAQVSGTANAINLTLDPPTSGYADGLLVRFIPAAANTAAVTLNVDGLGPGDLIRSDRLTPGLGELRPGSPVEVQYVDSVFVLLSRTENDCPQGYLQVNGRFCIQSTENASMLWFNAVNLCADRGARLCTWDEYYHACITWSASMTGLFDDWEWYDDTSDHTHTALQGGRFTCHSVRAIASLNVESHPSRCCYRLR